MHIDTQYFSDIRCALGESPIWDPVHKCLWWVDSLCGRIICCGQDGKNTKVYEFEQAVGSIGLAGEDLLAAFADGFYRVSMETGRRNLIAFREPHDATVRLNDGKVDPAGNYVCGEATLDGSSRGTVWRVEQDGRVSAMETGIAISNSICFSNCGEQFFLTDSLQEEIWRYSFDASDGRIGVREVYANCAEWGGAADGATVDANGNLWVAMVLGHSIVCFAPDGTVRQVIETPIPYPSCPTFGGQDYTTLFVTTISDSGGRLKSTDPNAGRLLAITGHGAKGLPSNVFGGDSLQHTP